MSESTDSDAELLGAWSRGDNDAGEALIRRHFALVYRFFANKTAAKVEDLVQQAFLACVESRERMHNVQSFRAFLLGICRHTLFAHFREQRRAHTPFDPLATSMHQLLGQTRGALSERLEQRALFEGLRQLPVEHQLLLELRYWEELTSTELAAIFDTNAATLRSRLVKARELLREAIERGTQDTALAAATLENLEAWARAQRADANAALARN